MEVNRGKNQGLCGLDGHEQPLALLGASFEIGGEITHARREYLAEVYRLHALSEEPVTTTILATRLEVSPPAVVRMMRRLAREGYLRRVPYKGVNLTADGEREALKSIRRHRLLEAFLVTVMRFGWDEVHEQAHGLEGVISDLFEDRMDELAGYPTRCPHGDPIPTKDGRIAPISDAPLLDFAEGEALIVRRVKTDDSAKLRYLREIGLVPDAPIKILGRAPFNGPVRLKINQQEPVIGTELAQAVRVERSQP